MVCDSTFLPQARPQKGGKGKHAGPALAQCSFGPQYGRAAQ